MIKITILTLLLILLNITQFFAQNTLWLTNGKKMQIGDYKLDNKDLIVYKNLKGKFKSIAKFDVFSIISDANNEIIIYQQDSTYDEAFNLLEMRAFVQGQYDAHKKFKSPAITFGGAGISGTAVVFISPLYSPLIPVVYCGVIGLTKTSEKKIIIPNEFESSNHYLLGYKKTTKQKRIKNAIFGSLIGLTAGFTTYVLINK